jgi:hypothetical protein
MRTSKLKTKDMIKTAKSTYSTHDSHGVTMEVEPENPGTFMIINAEASEFDTLIEAMRFQAEKNKEVCDEIIKKEKTFKTSLKFSDPSAPWNWKK